MKKFNKATILLVMVGLLFTLTIGCGGESPESLYDTAQFEEKQMNKAHATQLYEQIIREHPDSEWAEKAKVRLEELGKTQELLSN